MSTINSDSNSYNLYTQNNTQVSNSQGQTRVHHHHRQQVQGTTESSQTTSQATDSLTESSSN